MNPRKLIPVLALVAALLASVPTDLYATCSLTGQIKPAGGHRVSLVTCTNTANGTTAVNDEFTPVAPVLGGYVQWYSASDGAQTVTMSIFDKTFSSATAVNYATTSALASTAFGAGADFGTLILFEEPDATKSSQVAIFPGVWRVSYTSSAADTRAYTVRLHLLHQ